MPRITGSTQLRGVFSKAFCLGIALFCQHMSHAQDVVDVVEYFVRAQDARGAGLARKSKPVDVRPAKPEEIIVTMIKGEGKETQSLQQNPAIWSSGIVVQKPGTNRFLFAPRPLRKGTKAR